MNLHGGLFGILDGQDGRVLLPVYELDAEDLSGGEGRVYRNSGRDERFARVSFIGGDFIFKINCISLYERSISNPSQLSRHC